MLKTEALELLGGTPAAAAREVGVSTQAISQWPDQLPPRIVDRVQAALWRISQRNGEAAADQADQVAGQGV